MTEVWKKIDGFPGYEVSDLGRVRSWRSRNGKGRSKEPHLLTPTPFQGRPYLRVALTGNSGNVTQHRVHRLVLEVFVGPCPDGMEGCHSDGNPTNNALTNLRWDTKASNFLDQITHGTRRRGERHPRSSMSDKERANILAALNHLSGHSRRDNTGLVKQLAKEHGVSIGTIYKLRERAKK